MNVVFVEKNGLSAQHVHVKYIFNHGNNYAYCLTVVLIRFNMINSLIGILI